MSPLSFMAVSFGVIVLIQLILAGNQCASQFPGKGYCITNTANCPQSAREYPRLSNLLGCPYMNNKCCVVGGISGQQQTDRSQCGKASLAGLQSRIFNGDDAGPCDWPWVVSLRSKLRTSSSLTYGSTRHVCAGVLIDRYWVLTSATCILDAGFTVQNAPNQFIVVAGEYNKTGIDVDPRTGQQQEQLIGVQRAFLHPKYAYSNFDSIDINNPKLINSHSVGLVRLAQPINGACSGIICLPTLQEAQDNCASYSDCIITGWGFTSESFQVKQGHLDILKQGRVQMASRKGCDLVTQRLNLQNTRPEGSICQRPPRRLTGPCNGDTGGAVMCSSGSNWVVRGILPHNICQAGKFNLFVTDVTPYLQWISNTMRLNGGSQG